MREQVWIDENNGTLHVTFMTAVDAGIWGAFDPQSFDRALEQAEPPMKKVGDWIFTWIGDL